MKYRVLNAKLHLHFQSLVMKEIINLNSLCALAEQGSNKHNLPVSASDVQKALCIVKLDFLERFINFIRGRGVPEALFCAPHGQPPSLEQTLVERIILVFYMPEFGLVHQGFLVLRSLNILLNKSYNV